LNIPGAPDCTWIILGWHELWLYSFVLALKAPQRNGVLGLRQFWLPRLQAAIRAERAKFLGDAQPDDEEVGAINENDPAEKVGASTKFTFHSKFSFEVSVAECKLTMLNLLRPCVLRVDENTVTFLQTVVARSARSQALSQPDPIAPPVAPFHFEEQLMHNYRGKVAWTPSEHTWTLFIAKPKKQIVPACDLNNKTLRVEKSLPPKQYEAAKFHAYVRALQTWNALDGSNRLRIPIPVTAAPAAEKPAPAAEAVRS